MRKSLKMATCVALGFIGYIACESLAAAWVVRVLHDPLAHDVTPSPQIKVAYPADLATASQPSVRKVAQTEGTLPDEEGVQIEESVHVCLSDQKVAEFEATIRRFRDEAARLQGRADSAMFPEDTPHGIAVEFMRDAGINDRETRLFVGDWLDRFPVRLSRDELLWLVNRIQIDDWTLYGESADGALIDFLGVERLKGELSSGRLADLREWYAEEGTFD